MPEIKAKMVQEKETKNAVRYEDASFTGIGAIYLPKSVIYSALGKAEWPREIHITITID
jgi:hypothetical protein